SSETFWAKIALSLKAQLVVAKGEKNAPKTDGTRTPKPENTTRTSGELVGLVTACVASHERASEPCAKALELSGLSADEFWAKFAPKPATTPKPEPTTRPTPTAKPTTQQTVTEAQLLVMVKDCFAKYVAATTAKGDESLGHAAYEACTSAIAASGLSNEAFWAKFGTPQAPKI